MQHLALLAASCTLQSLLISETPAPRASGAFPAIISLSGGSGAPTLGCHLPLAACLQGEGDQSCAGNTHTVGAAERSLRTPSAPPGTKAEPRSPALCLHPLARHTQRAPPAGQTPTNISHRISAKSSLSFQFPFLLLVVFFFFFPQRH